MATVISATTRFGGRGEAKRAEFLGKAHVLLTQSQVALRAGDEASALELAYQAALRTAGARIAVSAVAQRKRKPHGAWNRRLILRLFLSFARGCLAVWKSRLIRL